MIVDAGPGREDRTRAVRADCRVANVDWTVADPLGRRERVPAHVVAARHDFRITGEHVARRSLEALPDHDETLVGHVGEGWRRVHLDPREVRAHLRRRPNGQRPLEAGRRPRVAAAANRPGGSEKPVASPPRRRLRGRCRRRAEQEVRPPGRAIGQEEAAGTAASKLGVLPVHAARKVPVGLRRPRRLPGCSRRSC